MSDLDSARNVNRGEIPRESNVDGTKSAINLVDLMQKTLPSNNEIAPPTKHITYVPPINGGERRDNPHKFEAPLDPDNNREAPAPDRRFAKNLLTEETKDPKAKEVLDALYQQQAEQGNPQAIFHKVYDAGLSENIQIDQFDGDASSKTLQKLHGHFPNTWNYHRNITFDLENGVIRDECGLRYKFVKNIQGKFEIEPLAGEYRKFTDGSVAHYNEVGNLVDMKMPQKTGIDHIEYVKGENSNLVDRIDLQDGTSFTREDGAATFSMHRVGKPDATVLLDEANENQIAYRDTKTEIEVTRFVDGTTVANRDGDTYFLKRGSKQWMKEAEPAPKYFGWGVVDNFYRNQVVDDEMQKKLNELR